MCPMPTSPPRTSSKLQLTADDERTDEEQRILEGIAALGTKDAKQVMTARTDMERSVQR